MLQFLIAFDQLLNTVIGGKADETLSARAYRLSDESLRWYLFMRFLDALFFWQEAHCLEAYESEMQRNHLPAEYR